jgi:hypothetical protein
MTDLLAFVKAIPDFYTLNSSEQIKYFAYYKLAIEEAELFMPKDISECFNLLHINPYSNISQYLSKFSQKGKSQLFLKRKIGYVLLSPVKQEIEKIVKVEQDIVLNPTNNLFSLSIFDNCRGYMVFYAKEASSCYDYGLYTSCLFMLRKMTEILIVDLFESKGLVSKIKKPTGDYFQLSDLIGALISESSWRITRIPKENFPKIKLLADSSVHSKRFSAKKPDIDNMKDNVRIAFEEMIHLIDYPNWKS